jgi:hypothetical protein
MGWRPLAVFRGGAGLGWVWCQSGRGLRRWRMILSRLWVTAHRCSSVSTITEGPDGDLFHADIAEVVHTHLNDEATLLVVEWWTPTHGLRRMERE